MAGPNDVILNVGAQLSPDTESKLQQSFARIEKNMKFTTPFATASRNVRDFNSELDRANQRVITLGASFAVLSTSIRVFKDIITSTTAVEKALTDINSVFQLSAKGLDQFSRGLFNVARETSQSFEKTAEAAKEFSRQGLGATEVLKRTRDAMVLTRLASLDAEEAVSTLTASINGFQKAALDSTQIVNKLATVDAQFAVSSKDLAQGLARAGAAASDAGVSFDQLIGLITSAQQTTARGGAVIGNALKTIFTRVERKDTLEAFEALGVAITDLQGNVLPAMGLLQNFANVYDRLGGAVKKQAAELVGGVYQINILKALLSDLSKGSSSVAEQAAKTSTNAADEAIKRNEALNKSLAALAQQAQTTYQQVGAKVGDLGIGNAAKGLLGGFTSSSLVQAFANAGSADTNSFGEKAAAGFIKGFGEAVIFGLGPVLTLALAKISLNVFSKVQKDFADIIGANRGAKEQAAIQEQIVGLYNAGDSALKRQLLTMGSLVERAAMVEAILAKGSARQSAIGAEINSLAGAVMTVRKTPRAASGYDPFSAEAAAIRSGVGGASSSAKPVLLKNFAYGGGVSGPIVANTSEWMVKSGAGSAIYNPAMIQKMGLPPGATPIAAGGYIPNAAEGFDTPLPSWAQSDAAQVYAYLKKAGMLDKIKQMAGQGMNAADIARSLNLPSDYNKPGVGGTNIMGQQAVRIARDWNMGAVAASPKVNQSIGAVGGGDFGVIRGSGGQFVSQAKVSELTQLFEAVQKAGNGDEARKLGKGVIDLAESFNKTSKEKVWEKLGKEYEAFDKGIYASVRAGLARASVSTTQYESRPWSGKPYTPPIGSATEYNSRLRIEGLIPANEALMGLGRVTIPGTSIYNAYGPIGPKAPPPSIFSRIGARFRDNPLATSVGLPLALGFAGGAFPSLFSESSQRGGTGSGMAISGISSALTGASTGSAIGSFIPGIGNLGGAAIGAVIGGLSGSLGKMTKSFDELAEEINTVNAKIRAQFENASEVARTQAQITELLASDQSPDEIQKSVRRLRTQVSTGLSKVEDPRVKALLGSGDPEDLKEAISILNQGGTERAQGQDIISAVKGALDTSVGNMGGALGYGKGASERISKALAPFFAGKSGRELAGYSRSAQSDPASAIQQILRDAGVDEKTIKESLPKFRFTSAGAQETSDLFQGGIAKAISGAVADRNQRPEILNRQESRAKRMSGLRAVSERYKGESEFSQIRSSSDLQISGVQQQIALASLLLLDIERLKQQGSLGLQNIRAQSAGARETQLLAGKSSLSDVLISKGGDSGQIRKLIDGLSSLSDVKGLIETLSSPQGIIAAGVSGAATPEFKKALMDLQRTMEKLDESENEQVRVTTTTNKLLYDQLAFSKTYAGARRDYQGAARAAGANTLTALNRFDTPDILSRSLTEGNLAGLNDEFNRSKGGMTRFEYQGRRMGIGLDADVNSRLNNSAATRYLLNNPNTLGARGLTGSQVTSSLLGEAEQNGLDGKSLKSLGQGFTAVFAGMKRDMNDLSKIGANLGQSLSSNLGNAFGDFVTGAKSGKDAFRAFAVSVLNDASRMFASQAIQGILGSFFGGVGGAGVGVGKSGGGSIGFAAGGKVPAMLTGGEYYIGPNAAKRIGYDTLHRLNRSQNLADGGMVRGGSGVKDDVPAKLPPGSFIIKKSAVNKLGPDYLDSLVGGKVQHRFFGGLLLGALVGGGLGYLTGGKKGAIAGALIGGIGGGLAQNYSQTGNLFQSGAGAGTFQFGASSGAGSTLSVGTSSYGGDAAIDMARTSGAGAVASTAAKAAAPMGIGTKLALGLGASALLGGVSQLLTPKDPKFTPMTAAEIHANRVAMERAQGSQVTPAGYFPWLSANQNGGQNLAGYIPPTRRLYSSGGVVDSAASPMSMAFAQGGMVDGMARSIAPTLFADGGMVSAGGGVESSSAPASTSRSSGAAANVSIKIEINNNGSTSSSASSDNKGSGQGGFGQDFAMKIEKQVRGIVQQELITQSRSDGFFAQKGRFVQRGG